MKPIAIIALFAPLLLVITAYFSVKPLTKGDTKKKDWKTFRNSRTYQIVQQKNGKFSVLYYGEIFKSDSGWKSTDFKEKDAQEWINRHMELGFNGPQLETKYQEK